VTALAGDVVGDVAQVLDPVLDQVVAPVTALAGDVIGDTVQVVGPVIEQVTAPVTDLLGSLLGPGSTGGQPILATSVVVASSGSIDFEGVPPASPLGLDDLFSGGRYSDYNLALQADASISANPASGGPLPNLDLAVDLNIAHDAGTPPDNGQGGQGSHLQVALSGVLGDIGLHGLGL
jgi:hypothetical protein